MNRHNFLYYLTGITGLATFCFILYSLAYITIPSTNKELFIHAIGIVEGVAVTIFQYHFGTSKDKKGDGNA